MRIKPNNTYQYNLIKHLYLNIINIELSSAYKTELHKYTKI